MTKLERIILKSHPVAYLIFKSKQLILPGFKGVPLYDVLKFFLNQVNKVGLNERASAIAFNFIMAIPAACICVFTLVPYLPVSKLFTRELLRLTRDISPNQNIYNLVSTFLNDFLNTQRGSLLSVGFLLVIYYASNAMLTVIRTFDKSIYQHEAKTGFFKKRWKAIRLTLVVLGLLIGTILILIGQGYLFDKILTYMNVNATGIFWFKVLRWLITLCLFYYGIALIYKLGPSVKKRWHTFTPGALVATFLTVSMTFIFSFWVNHFSNYNKVYGSIGSILMLMLLIYLNSLILLVGFELNVSITYLKDEADERKTSGLRSFILEDDLPKK